MIMSVNPATHTHTPYCHEYILAFYLWDHIDFYFDVIIHVCVCVCVCVFMCVCERVCVFLRVCMHLFMTVYLFRSGAECLFVCVCVCVHTISSQRVSQHVCGVKK